MDFQTACQELEKNHELFMNSDDLDEMVRLNNRMDELIDLKEKLWKEKYANNR
jgi:hypothetical protein